MFIVQPTGVKSNCIFFFHFLLQKKFVIASSTKNIIEKLSWGVTIYNVVSESGAIYVQGSCQ